MFWDDVSLPSTDSPEMRPLDDGLEVGESEKDEGDRIGM